MRRVMSAISINLLFNLGDLDVAGMTEYSEGRQKPDDHADDNNDVEDLLDLGIHGNVGVHEPEQDTDDDESYYERDHFQPLVKLVRLFSMYDDTVREDGVPWGVYPMHCYSFQRVMGAALTSARAGHAPG